MGGPDQGDPGPPTGPWSCVSLDLAAQTGRRKSQSVPTHIPLREFRERPDVPAQAPRYAERDERSKMATILAGANIIERLQSDRPLFHMGGGARWDSLPATLEAIRGSVQPGHETIETGAGASTVVFAAAGASHTAISPDNEEHERIRAYCQRIGVDDSQLSFVVGRSEDVLPSILAHDRTLDFAFIDGAHAFPFPAVDWCYITRALKLRGKLLMDDITIPSVAPVFRHMMVEPNWELDRVLDDRAAILTLTADPAPGDWPAQRTNAGYPDFGFAPLPKRVSLESRHRLTQAARVVARHSPALRRAYRRVANGTTPST